MTANLLTVPSTKGQTNDRHHQIVMTGFDSPNPEAHKSRSISAAFLCQHGSPYNGRAVREGAIPAGPQAGLSTRTVPSTRLTAGERSYRPQPEDSKMANATSTGAIRPEITNTVQLADGTAQTVFWVREAAVIKRIRRKLAKRNHRFVISREATRARTEFGLYSILDANGDVLQRDANLADLARFLNVLADHETLEPARERGWRYHVCKRVAVEHDGITRVCVEPITKTFTSEKAAWKAAEHIEDRHGLVLFPWTRLKPRHWNGSKSSRPAIRPIWQRLMPLSPPTRSCAIFVDLKAAHRPGGVRSRLTCSCSKIPPGRENQLPIVLLKLPACWL